MDKHNIFKPQISKVFPRPLCTRPILIENKNFDLAMIRNNGYCTFNGYVDIRNTREDYLGQRVSRNILVETKSQKTDFWKEYQKSKSALMRECYDREKQKIEWAKAERCYTEDFLGNRVYMFLAVACGNCEICSDKRQNDFSTRVNMESAVSWTAPLMVTLTYTEEFLPREVNTQMAWREIKKNKCFCEPETNISENISDKDWNDFCDYMAETDRMLEQLAINLEAIVTNNKLPIKKELAELRREHLRKDEQGIIWHLYDRGPATECDGKILRETLYQRDIQLFLKRLRRKWEYENYFPLSFGKWDETSKKRYSDFRDTHPFRYVAVGEYGSKYGRPHTHLLLWNVPYQIKSCFDFGEIDRCHNDILSCWQMCEKNSSQCEVARDAGRYVGKYLSKKNKNGRKGTFQSSNRGGGIGSGIIDQNKEFLQTNPEQQKIGFIGKGGKFEEYTLGKYATHRVFPTIKSMLPNEIKEQNSQVVSILTDLYMLSHVIGMGVKKRSVADGNEIQTISLPSQSYLDFLQRKSLSLCFAPQVLQYELPNTIDGDLLHNFRAKYMNTFQNDRATFGDKKSAKTYMIETEYERYLYSMRKATNHIENTLQYLEARYKELYVKYCTDAEKVSRETMEQIEDLDMLGILHLDKYKKGKRKGQIIMKNVFNPNKVDLYIERNQIHNSAIERPAITDEQILIAHNSAKVKLMDAQTRETF